MDSPDSTLCKDTEVSTLCEGRGILVPGRKGQITVHQFVRVWIARLTNQNAAPNTQLRLQNGEKCWFSSGGGDETRTHTTAVKVVKFARALHPMGAGWHEWFLSFLSIGMYIQRLQPEILPWLQNTTISTYVILCIYSSEPIRGESRSTGAPCSTVWNLSNLNS